MAEDEVTTLLVRGGIDFLRLSAVQKAGVNNLMNYTHTHTWGGVAFSSFQMFFLQKIKSHHVKLT